MGKFVAFAVVVILACSLPALAAETTGQIKAVDAAGSSFTLEDGTQLWLSDGAAAGLAPGEKVRATYETKGDRNVVTELGRLTMGPEGRETTNFGGPTGVSVDSEQGMN